MEFDDQLRRYFGTSDLALLSPDGVAAGVEKIQVDFGLERARERRFALWVLLHMFGAAPDLDVAFDNEDDRNSARDFMAMVDRAADE
ncbi:MAG: hypothetical protein IE933_14910 [Sphingomonadales bacterium]|nr:hypothetical protein [Sphingomonadales bacterium]MBD3773954.1 hypothetical protein [Paracoccaceae bacterium]